MIADMTCFCWDSGASVENITMSLVLPSFVTVKLTSTKCSSTLSGLRCERVMEELGAR